MPSDVCSSCGQPVQRTPSSRPEIICRECRWEQRIVRKAEQQARKLSPSDAGRRAAQARWANTQRRADDSGLRPHGTKAALSRHYSRGEKPCDVCRQAENERHRGRAPYGTRAGTCSQCGKVVWRGHDSRDEIICRDCRRRATPATMVCALADCGKEFEPKPKSRRRSHLGRTIYCSKSCATSAGNRARTGTLNLSPEQWQERQKARIAAKNRKRRMRLNAAPWDGVTDETILERDRWTCRMPICIYGSRRISKTRKFPDKRSATIDHILPLSLGGDDTQYNKRAAHLSCNVSRHIRLDDQMPLAFGADLDGIPRRAPKASKPKPMRSCRICGELITGMQCDLHQPVRFVQCTRCDAPIARHVNSKRRVCVACATRPCVVPGCNDPVFFAATDWCAAHHHRHQKYGDVLADIPVAVDRTERIEVAALIDPTRIWHAARSITKSATRPTAASANDGICPSCENYPLASCCGQAS